VKFASLLHDIGKIAIPADILNKPGKLNPIELGLIRQHPRSGYEILKDIDFGIPVSETVLQHHERLDGSGYPGGLRREEISFEAMIIAVADVVEAISSHRPYRAALGIDEAVSEIKTKSGILYEEKVVRSCLEILESGFSF
jgi:HD-GYP domain-containing protein (c-di-GMP phosphodiesterase class II)